jgi:small subunit ribosomal protein S17
MSDLSKRKIREGLVVSNKMNKTIVVAIQTRKVHPLYKKAIKVTKKYKAHDENNACKIGDKVKIVETRPLSKEKRWRVVEIMSKREVPATKP